MKLTAISKQQCASAEKLGKLLRRARFDKGLTILAAAKRGGTNKSTMGRLEAGQIPDPSSGVVEVISRLGRLYGLDQASLLKLVGRCRDGHGRPAPAMKSASPLRPESLTSYEIKELCRFLKILRGARPR